MTFTVDWFTGYIPSWKNIFEKNGRPMNVLEIGSFEGRSTCWILENTEAHVTCVDTWEGSPEHTDEEKNNLYSRFMENIECYKDRVTILRGESGVIVRQIPCETKFDFIYIDGSHYSQDVLEDAVLSWRLLSPGGILIFDDYCWCVGGTDILDLRNPRRGIQSFVKVYEPEILHIGQQLIVKKK
jgi:predicted O-methyltransferase YrrM